MLKISDLCNSAKAGQIYVPLNLIVLKTTKRHAENTMKTKAPSQGITLETCIGYFSLGPPAPVGYLVVNAFQSYHHRFGGSSTGILYS